MNSKEFGDIIKNLREERGLSRDGLAKNINISYSALSKYETNNRFPDKETITKIADYFDVTTDYLLGRTNEKQPKKERFQGVNTIAAHRLGNIEQLSDEGLEELDNYIELLKLKYKK